MTTWIEIEYPEDPDFEWPTIWTEVSYPTTTWTLEE